MTTVLIRVLSVALLASAAIWLLVEPSWEPLVAALAGAIGVASQLGSGPTARPATSAEVVSKPDTAGTVATPDRPSILVLPFQNLSPDPEDAYLSDGLTEEITAHVACCGLLRVISRNSALMLKDARKETRRIASELDVQWVLEGSVRKDGDALRITAQLVDAARDRHAWSETFDGTLADVFRFQEDVAQAIVGALEVQFSPNEERRLAARRMDDLQAYECYLRARHEFWTMSDGATDRSLELIDRGLELLGDDPLLWAARGMGLFQLVNSMSRLAETYEGLLREARDCADRALELDPDSAPAHTVLGYVHVNSGKPHEAVRHFSRAIELDPDNPESLHYLGFMGAIGGWDRQWTRSLLERVGDLDPLTPISRGAIGWLYWFEGDFARALDALGDFFRQAEDGKSPFRAFAVYLHAAAGDRAEADRITSQMKQDSGGHMTTALATFLMHGMRGEPEAARQSVTPDLEEGAQWDDVWPLMMASGYALCGESDQAFGWLERAIGCGVTNVTYLTEVDPFLACLRDHDRFTSAVELARDLGTSIPRGLDRTPSF